MRSIRAIPLAAALFSAGFLSSAAQAQDSFIDLTGIGQAVLDVLPSAEPVPEQDIIDEPALQPRKKKKRRARADVIDPQAALARTAPPTEIAPRQPKTISYDTDQPPGTIVISTANRELFYVKGDGKAFRYRIAVGKEGFDWSGTKRVTGITRWPDWRPPAEMRERRPELPEFMPGGPGNPLGARAIYLGSSLYRIHGTNEPGSIGRRASSGCFRMHNRDVVHLASIVRLGTKVVVLDRNNRQTTRAASGPPVKAKSIRSTTQTALKAKQRIRRAAPRVIPDEYSASETPLPVIFQ
jgi:lipoprotein-anchoring transpeptidase ErfK/SrfK